MEPGGGTVASIPLGDFLMTAEPVWVWDAAARKILWANQAGRSFWRADSLDALRARRFPTRGKWIELLAELAAAPGGAREWLHVVDLGRALGRPAVRCQIQALQVAGEKPGLIIRILDYPPVPASDATQPAASASMPGPRGKSSSVKPPARETVATKLRANERRQARAPAVTVIPPGDMLALQVQELCHEMRNPLSVIRGFAERIREATAPGRQHGQLGAYADNIIEGADLAMAILADFSGRLLNPEQRRPETGAADLKGSVESCLRLISPLAKSSGVKIRRRLPGSLPPLITADRVLKQVLLNLLMNAIRHHKTGGEIKILASRRRDGAVRLAVMDDGKGMTKKEIRTALAKSRKPPAPQPGRSGVGLPLVKRLIEAEGGSIAIASERGKGTTVEIILPAAA
jgi:signal transduction histidine kinase